MTRRTIWRMLNCSLWPATHHATHILYMYIFHPKVSKFLQSNGRCSLPQSPVLLTMAWNGVIHQLLNLHQFIRGRSRWSYSPSSCVWHQVLQHAVWVEGAWKLPICSGQGSVSGHMWRAYRWSHDSPFNPWWVETTCWWILQAVKFPPLCGSYWWQACGHQKASSVWLAILQLQVLFCIILLAIIDSDYNFFSGAMLVESMIQ